jgi:hypothetical protein
MASRKRRRPPIPGVAEEIEEPLPGLLAQGLLVGGGAELFGEGGGV